MRAIVDLIEAQTRATIKEATFHSFMVGVHNALNHGEVFGLYYNDDENLAKIFEHVEAILKIARDNEL
jgi:hypothetical protein